MMGKVVVVFDAAWLDERGSRTTYNVKGIGYTYGSLVLLDRTNVFPGIFLRDESTGEWKKVRTVDECLWIKVEGSEEFQSPEEFGFAIDRDGDIAVVPLVECVDNKGIPGLTVGAKYQIIKEEVNGEVLYVVGDEGVCVGYASWRFRL